VTIVAVWTKKVIQDLCEITSSKRIYAANYQSEGIPFYRGKEIIEKHKGNLEVSIKLFITKSKYHDIKKKFGVPQPGDLLLTSVGTLGVPYVIKDGEEFYFKDGNLTWFRYFKGLDNKYLFYWLLSPQGKAELKKCTIGSSQSAFTIVLLKGMELELPPLPIQRKIGAVLSAYDDLIEINTRRIRILEQMAQTVYREWFGKVDAQSLPEGWEEVTISEIASIHRGKSYRSSELLDEGGLPFLNLKCVDRNGGFRQDGIKRFKGDYKDTQTAKPGDIIIGLTDMTQERRIIARAARVPDTGEIFFIMSMDLVKLIAKSGLSQSYLYTMLRYSSFPDEVKEYANGVNVLHLSPQYIEDYKFYLPSKLLTDRFGEMADATYQLIDNLQKKNSNLRRTRDLLLPRLVSGEVGVDEMELAV